MLIPKSTFHDLTAWLGGVAGGQPQTAANAGYSMAINLFLKMMRFYYIPLYHID